MEEVRHTGSVSQKLCEKCFFNYSTKRPDVFLFLISLSSPQCGHDSPAWLIEEGPGLWTVDHCPLSPIGIVLRCKVTPVIP